MNQRTKDSLISIFLTIGVASLPLLYLFQVSYWIVLDTGGWGGEPTGTRALLTLGGMYVSNLILPAILISIVTALILPKYHKKSSNVANFLPLLMFSVCLVIAIISFMTNSLGIILSGSTSGTVLGVGAILSGVLAIIVALLYLTVFILTHVKGQSELELRIDNLKKLLDKEYITQDQFEESKAKLVAELS